MCTWNLQHRTQKLMQSRVSGVHHSQKAEQGLLGFRIRHPKTLGGLETLGGSCLRSGPGMADFGVVPLPFSTRTCPSFARCINFHLPRRPSRHALYNILALWLVELQLGFFYAIRMSILYIYISIVYNVVKSTLR